jgi:hypothetical protein
MRACPALVVGEDAPFLLGQHLALLEACDDALERPSKSSCTTTLSPRRPAPIAASLQMFASSAPVRPAV